MAQGVTNLGTHASTGIGGQRVVIPFGQTALAGKRPPFRKTPPLRERPHCPAKRNLRTARERGNGQAFLVEPCTGGLFGLRFPLHWRGGGSARSLRSRRNDGPSSASKKGKRRAAGGDAPLPDTFSPPPFFFPCLVQMRHRRRHSASDVRSWRNLHQTPRCQRRAEVPPHLSCRLFHPNPSKTPRNFNY